MDARERWQALQAHLSTARAFAEAGDHARALDEVERALAVDPEFLAAHSLREQLTARLPLAPPRSAAAADLAPELSPELSPEPPPPPVVVLEERVRARRAERRLTAACDALAAGDLKAAGIALDEARELGADPGDVLRVEQAIAVRRTQRRSRGRGAKRVGPWLAAAGTVAAGVFAASYIGEYNPIPSRSMVTVEPAPAAAEPTGTSGDGSAAAAPAGSVAVRQDVTRASVIVTPVVSRTPAPAPPPVTTEPRMAAKEPMPELPPAKAAVAPLVPAPPPAVAPSLASSTSVDPLSLPPGQLVAPPRVDDSGVRDTLQRYRSAYEQLNAKSARAVWPAVDERALARAFDGLASQRLNFDKCDVSLHGDAATATCRGTTRFVPKVGSREATVEPRTWQFTLRRGDAGWAIETARAER